MPFNNLFKRFTAPALLQRVSSASNADATTPSDGNSVKSLTFPQRHSMTPTSTAPRSPSEASAWTVACQQDETSEQRKTDAKNRVKSMRDFLRNEAPAPIPHTRPESTSGSDSDDRHDSFMVSKDVDTDKSLEARIGPKLAPGRDGDDRWDSPDFSKSLLEFLRNEAPSTVQHTESESGPSSDYDDPLDDSAVSGDINTDKLLENKTMPKSVHGSDSNNGCDSSKLSEDTDTDQSTEETTLLPLLRNDILWLSLCLIKNPRHGQVCRVCSTAFNSRMHEKRDVAWRIHSCGHYIHTACLEDFGIRTTEAPPACPMCRRLHGRIENMPEKLRNATIKRIEKRLDPSLWLTRHSSEWLPLCG
jgi:hypothetical protein